MMDIRERVREALSNAKENGYDQSDLAAIEVAEDLQHFDADLEGESIIDIHLAVLDCRYGFVVEIPPNYI